MSSWSLIRMKSPPSVFTVRPRRVQQAATSVAAVSFDLAMTGAVMRGGLFGGVLLENFTVSVVTNLLPVSEFWATKSENDPLHSAKYNHGFHVEKTAFSQER